MILRRLYLYLVSGAALGLLAAGLTLLGGTAMYFVFNDPAAQAYRTQLAIYTAMTLVALPVWAVHFWVARRFAQRDPAERASAIRRLYFYFACLGSAIGALVALAFTATDLIRPLIDTCTSGTVIVPNAGREFFTCPNMPDWLNASQQGWTAIVYIAIWAFHYRIAARDRAAVGETGASATLRRWYVYVVLLVSLLAMLIGASGFLEVAWLKAWHSSLGDNRYMGDPAGLFVAGAIVWSFHALTIARDQVSDDRHSTLRALQGFIAVAVSMAVALVGASQILFYLLAHLLRIDQPTDLPTDLLGRLAAPAAQLVVFGTAWFFMRRRLAHDARTQEADRQAGIRRLYTNLAALISLGTGAIGAGGLLWTLAEQVEAPIIGVRATNWRAPFSFWVTLLVVGAIVWVAHWRPTPWATDRQSLSRRLYVWAAVLGSVLVILAACVGMLAALLRQVFSANPTLSDPANLDFGHYLAVILVAAGVGVYHLRVLRADAAARPPKAVEPLAAAVAAAAPPAAAGVVVAATEVADPHTHRYVLSVTDATEDDVHQALASLPPHAAYKLTPTEQSAVAVDGR